MSFETTETAPAVEKNLHKYFIFDGGLNQMNTNISWTQITWPLLITPWQILTTYSEVTKEMKEAELFMSDSDHLTLSSVSEVS